MYLFIIRSKISALTRLWIFN